MVDEKEQKEQKLTAQQFQILSEEISTLSGVSSRADLMSRLGRQYDGDRDIYQALGYLTDILFADYESKYSRQDIARAIIDRPVEATWKGGVKLVEIDTKNESPLQKEWVKLDDELSLNQKFVRVDKLTGVGHYGVLLLGLNDVRRREDLIRPVTPGKRKLVYVKPLSEGSAKINKWEKRSNEKRFGLPTVYNITITEPDGGSSSQIAVHHSRVIHITDDLLESETQGTPRLKPVFNRLMDLEKLVGGSAEMFWRGARPGYQAIVKDGAKNLDTASLQATFDEYEHNLRRVFAMMGVEWKALEQQIENPTAQVLVQLQMISAVTGIPLRKLIGSEVGQLASTQDESSWFNLVQARRENSAEPSIVRPFVDRCIEYGILPSPKTAYVVVWEDLWSPSEKERAEVGAIRANALDKYSKAIAQDIIPSDMVPQVLLGLTAEEAELVNKKRGNAVKEEEADFIEEEEDE